ncbi:MAG TPA: sigma-70 family RNA polymerase sigma factor [Opitutus sp.]|nr:sigma-70 family RNA polymerase sigma factor [Opitutus sp.]
MNLSPSAVETLVSEHAKFRRFLERRVGNVAAAEDILQESLLKALQHGGELRRGEKVTPWFYRILRNAIVDHYRRNGTESRKAEGLLNELKVHGEIELPHQDWERAVCSCFEGLLPELNPRYAQVLRRIDLEAEPKDAVAAELGISIATLNVTLHRARQALRRQLEIFCGACSREHCLACACGETHRRSRQQKV